MGNPTQLAFIRERRKLLKHELNLILDLFSLFLKNIESGLITKSTFLSDIKDEIRFAMSWN